MLLTREMVESLLKDPEQFSIVNRTDHAEWFGGMKPRRLFDFNAAQDIWATTPGMVFDASKGLFATSPEGKVLKVNLDVEVGLTGAAMEVVLKDGRFVAVKAG